MQYFLRTISKRCGDVECQEVTGAEEAAVHPRVVQRNWLEEQARWWIVKLLGSCCKNSQGSDTSVCVMRPRITGDILWTRHLPSNGGILKVT